MVGDFTEDQVAKVRKMHIIRAQSVRAVFEFYRINNCLNASVSPDDAVLNELSRAQHVEQLIFDEIEDGYDEIHSNIREDQENVRGQDGGWQVLRDDDELVVMERRVGLSDASRVLLQEEHELLDKSCGGGTLQEREVLVKRSNKMPMDVSGDLLTKMFPHLFPYGHGHPDETRRVPGSLKECVKHYLMLSARRFAEDELFTVVAFDRIAMKNMYTQNGLRCQRSPQVYERFQSIDASQLKEALLDNEQRQQGRRHASSTQRSVAHKALKTVEIASAAVWDSNAERYKCHQKAIAYQTCFGIPALFITLTPNTDNSLAMAYRTGKMSVSSLFDILESSVPRRTELREASLGNDAASARLFVYQVNIEHALGLYLTTGKPMPFNSLFGDVEAYFGMVDTQGRGTLHIHFLIWLSNIPSSTAELEEKLAGLCTPEFQEAVVPYMDSIIRNQLPLSLERYACSNCGASYSELLDLKIPPRPSKTLGVAPSAIGHMAGRWNPLLCTVTHAKTRSVLSTYYGTFFYKADLCTGRLGSASWKLQR